MAKQGDPELPPGMVDTAASAPSSAGPSQELVERFAVLRHVDGAAATLDAGSAPTMMPAPVPAGPGSASPPEATARYSFESVFARGGLGQIRRAYDHRLRRHVAVKEIQGPSAGSVAEARFRQEALLAARLEHPSIVPIHDIGEHASGEPYYCMKLIDGRTLDAIVRDAPALADRLALVPHVLAIADALAFAHDRGVIHRDLKPANVLIGPFGETIVIDWGLAKDLRARDTASAAGAGLLRDAAMAADLSRTGEFLGTLPFMPPEQAEGGEVDARADVYAIGAILYFVLSGHIPYEQETALATLEALLRGPPPDLGARVVGLPADLLAIVRKAMSHAAADRYASARDLSADLRSFLAGRLVAARPYSPLDLVRHYARRYRAVLSVACVGVALLATLGVYSYAQVTAQRDAADAERDAARVAQAGAEASRRETRVQANEALLAYARGALDTDLAAVFRSLGRVEFDDDRTTRRVRLLALAAEARGAPSSIARGPKRQIVEIAALHGGGLVGIDAGGDCWRWDGPEGAGHMVLSSPDPNAVLRIATDAPVWAVVGQTVGLVVRGEAKPLSIDVSVVPGLSPRNPYAYRWELARDGSKLIALAPKGTWGSLPPGAPAYVWDLAVDPPTVAVVPGEQTLAIMSPDASMIASAAGTYAVGAGGLELDRTIPSDLRPLLFSGSGKYLIGERADELVSWSREEHTFRRLVDRANYHDEDPFNPTNQVLGSTAEDELLLLKHRPFFSELALRSLVTGELRWIRQFHDAAVRSSWGARGESYDLVVAAHGDGMAMRELDHWLLGSRTTGYLAARLDVGRHASAAWLASGEFALARDAEVWRWSDLAGQGVADPWLPVTAMAGEFAVYASPVRHPETDYVADAPVREEVVAPVQLRRRNWRDGSETAIACSFTFAGHYNAKLAIDAGGRVLWGDEHGKLCLEAVDGKAWSFEVAAGVSALALGSDARAFALGFADGTLMSWIDPESPPRTKKLGVGLWSVTITPGGTGFVVRDMENRTTLVPAGDGEPIELAGPQPRSPDARVEVAVHPAGGEVALTIARQDVLVRRSLITGASSSRVLALHRNAPVLAYSPGGARLVVATAGPGLMVLGPDLEEAEITLPEAAERLAFIGEDHVAVLGKHGSLIRVDLQIHEAVVLRRNFRTEEGALVAEPDGGVATHGAGMQRLAADRVPREAEALRVWTRARAAALGRE